MRRHAGNTAVIIVLILVFLGGSILASNKAVAIRSQNGRLSPKIVHMPMAGFEPVVADVLWIRLVQYMGSYYNSADYDRTVWADSLYRKFDRLTSLDPGFTIAYYYGALLLSVESPDHALKLIDRGIEYIPPDQMDWRLPFYGAFISYQYSDDPERFDDGIKYLDIVTRFENCPSFIPRFEALVKEKRGTPGAALEVWYDLHKESEPADKIIIRGHLMRVVNNILTKSDNEELKARAREILKEVTGSDSIPENYFGDEGLEETEDAT